MNNPDTMSLSMGSLKVTAPHMHLIWVTVTHKDQWYGVMREARHWFGKNWQCQSKVLRKLRGGTEPIVTWFAVPDVQFATWISVKLAVQAKIDANKY